MRAIPYALSAVAIASCSVGSLDLAGKACPCSDGYTCDAASNTCVSQAVRVDARSPDSPVPPDAAPGDPLLQITEFKPVWQTDKTVRWTWTVTGDARSFASYELTWADTAAKVESDVGVATLGSPDKPELGAFDARGGKTSGPVSLWTTTFHETNEPIFARVTVRDTRGHTSSSNVASATLLVPTGPYRILFNGANEVVARPDSFTFQPERQNRYAFTTACAGGKPACWNHVELSGKALPGPGEPTWELTGLDAENFASAFLRVRIAGDAMRSGYDDDATANPRPAVYDSSIGLKPAGCVGAADECEWRFTGFTYVGESPRAIQVPLRELTNAAGKLTFARLQAAQLKIGAIAMSGTWRNGTKLDVAELVVRW